MARIKKNHLSDLIAIAKGMKKDGYSNNEIAEETGLSIRIIQNLTSK